VVQKLAGFRLVSDPAVCLIASAAPLVTSMRVVTIIGFADVASPSVSGARWRVVVGSGAITVPVPALMLLLLMAAVAPLIVTIVVDFVT